MTTKRNRSATDLADEAADVIETTALRGEQLRAFLAAFLCECARDGDIESMRRGIKRAMARHARALKGAR